MKPLNGRSKTSSACISVTFSSTSVTGPPGIFSTLTILVPPTRAHSARIWRTVASFARIDTRPSCIVTERSANAGDAVSSTAATPATTTFERRAHNDRKDTRRTNEVLRILRTLRSIMAGSWSRQRRVEAAAVGHLRSVIRIPDRLAALQPVLLHHRAVGHLDIVADAGAGDLRVGHDRIAEPRERGARRLQIGGLLEFPGGRIDRRAAGPERRRFGGDAARIVPAVAQAVRIQRELNPQGGVDDWLQVR